MLIMLTSIKLSILLRTITVLRREGFPKPYEALKGLTRKNEAVTMESVHEFIDTLPVSSELKNELKAIAPSNYTGIQLV